MHHVGVTSTRIYEHGCGALAIVATSKTRPSTKFLNPPRVCTATMSLFAFLPLASLAYAFPPGQGSQHGRPPFGHSPPYGPPHHGGPPQPVAYFLDNNPAGSSIVSLRIGENGMLMGDPMKTSTGGRGSIEVNGTGAPFASDGLGSQGSVTVSGNVRLPQPSVPVCAANRAHRCSLPSMLEATPFPCSRSTRPSRGRPNLWESQRTLSASFLSL